MKKTYVIIFAVIFAVVLLLGAVFQVYRFLNPPEPKAGVWQNDELHMTMEFGPNGNSAVITENGNTVYCDVCGVFNTSKYGIFETKEPIKGVKGLAQYLNIGTTKAQDIINSNTLQENGVAYRVGNGWIFNAQKLDEILSKNPTLLYKRNK